MRIDRQRARPGACRDRVGAGGGDGARQLGQPSL
jgi:hypothetical protein